MVPTLPVISLELGVPNILCPFIAILSLPTPVVPSKVHTYIANHLFMSLSLSTTIEHL